MKYIFIFLLILTLLPIKTFANHANIKINNTEITVEIADTPKLKRKGLMFRKYLPEKNGMIFLFDKPQKTNFWMKNVNFPLDLIFIYKNKIIKIYKKLPPCKSKHCPIYPSKVLTECVIELNGGFCQKYGIQVGQKIIFDKRLENLVKNLQNYNKGIKL